MHTQRHWWSTGHHYRSCLNHLLNPSNSAKNKWCPGACRFNKGPSVWVLIYSRGNHSLLNARGCRPCGVAVLGTKNRGSKGNKQQTDIHMSIRNFNETDGRIHNSRENINRDHINEVLRTRSVCMYRPALEVCFPHSNDCAAAKQYLQDCGVSSAGIASSPYTGAR